MNILYATDGSPDALAAGELLSHFDWGIGDRLTVISVVQNFVLLTGRIDNGSSEWLDAIGDEEASAAKRAVEDAAERLDPFFPMVQTRVHLGFPAQEILNAAGEIGADLIVVGSQGRSALSEWVLGSISQSVLEKAGCSVLVGRRKAGPLSQILLAFDGSKEAYTALGWVRCLPLHDDLRVEVVSVAEPVPMPASGLLIGYPEGFESLYGQVLEIERNAARELAEKAAEGLSARGIRAGVHSCVGEPAHEIARLAEEWASDLVVIGAHSRQGWIGDLLGNTTRGVLKNTSCSMLVARSARSRPSEQLEEPEMEAAAR